MKNQTSKEKPVNLNLQEDFSPPASEEWRKAADKLLKGAPYDKIMLTKTYEGITLRPMYRTEDTESIPDIDALPGFAPYQRGGSAAGYHSRPWDIAQEIHLSSPEEFNQALKHDLERGQTAVRLLPDNVTLAGLDSDHGKAGQTGRGGVTLTTLEDWETALDGVDPETAPLFIRAGSAGILVTAFLAALCKRHGSHIASLHGGIESDPLGTLAVSGSLPLALTHLYDEIATLTAWAVDNAPNLTTVSASGDAFHNGGASAVQELGFAVACGAEYLREMIDRNIPADQIAPRIRFTFALGSNFFMEIAKLRAARMLWRQVVEAFGGGEEAQKMRIHTRTSSRNKTIYDPYVNILRAATETLSGIAGGSDSIHTGHFDEPLGLPDEFSRRIARNTQIILKEESHFDRVIDPGGGSWYIEALTQEVADNAWQLFQQVEKRGGMYRALGEGFPQSKIEETARQRAENIALRKDKLIGTNIYPNLKEKPPSVRQPAYEEIFKQRAAYLKRFRSTGDINKHIAPLEKLKQILTSGKEQLMEAVIEAALASATIGEISQTLRAEKPAEPGITPLQTHRDGEIFERLRMAMEDYQSKTGSTPKVFLANMGPVSQHKARADFSSGFFQIAGFEIIENKGFGSPEEAARAAVDSGASIVVICSTDATYPDVVEPIAAQIKNAKPETIMVLAGFPKEQLESYSEAGIDEFIHIRANAHDLLAKFMKTLGVI